MSARGWFWNTPTSSGFRDEASVEVWWANQPAGLDGSKDAGGEVVVVEVVVVEVVEEGEGGVANRVARTSWAMLTLISFSRPN